MSRSFDVVVAGGGVIGNAVAYHLARAKARVLVLERDPLGGRATRAAAGMLAAQDEAGEDESFLDFCVASRELFKTLVPEVEELSGLRTGWAATGLWRAAADEAEAARLKKKAERQTARGLPAVWLSAAESRRELPGMETPHGAFLAPGDGLIHPVLWARALAEAAKRRGAVFQTAAALSFTRVGERVTGVRTQEEYFPSGTAVIAAGAWTPALLEDIGLHLPLEPVKGQILVLGGAAPVPAPVYAADGYVVPRAEGPGAAPCVLVGATVERAGFDEAPTEAARERLSAWADKWCPSLKGRPVIGVQAGLRPGSSDGKPLIGPAPGWEGLAMACGHFRNGILLSPLTGRLTADGVLAGRWDPAAAYAPARFLSETVETP